MKNKNQFIKIYNRAVKEIPAYRNFLQEFGFNSKAIRDYKDWSKIPITNKDNYINKYEILERISAKKVSPLIYGSSGSAGIPTYWYGNEKRELSSAKLHEKLFSNMFEIKKDTKTLMIVCFAMGIWIASHHTIAAARYLNRKGYNISVISPGYALDDIVDIFKNLAKNYNKLIIAAHPGFAMDVINRISSLNLLRKGLDIRVIVTGDKINEKWRKDMTNLLGKSNHYNTVSSIYGSSDAGLMGYETQFTIYLKYLINNNKNFKNELVGSYMSEPAVYQYEPKEIFFEEVNNELLITVDTASPLVKYNIFDVGKIVSYKEIVNLLKKYNLYKQAKKFDVDIWSMPLLILYGRSNVAVTFYALHIYPDNIKSGLMKNSVKKYLSGNYFAYTKKIRNSKVEQFHINLELNKNIKITKNSYNKIKNSLIDSLEKSNIEYRKLRSMIKSKADPILHFQVYDSKKLKISQQKGVWQEKNKKAKLVL
jgi:phenylacetate-CoA ligase